MLLILYSFIHFWPIIDKPDPVSNCSVSHQSSESLQIACNEGFSGGLPQNFLLEILTIDGTLAGSVPLEETTSQRPYLPAELKTFNQTSMKPVFIVRGLDADTTYVGQVTAVNAKGRSEPFVVRVVTLRPPETQKNVGPGKSEGSSPLFSIFSKFPRVHSPSRVVANSIATTTTVIELRKAKKIRRKVTCSRHRDTNLLSAVNKNVLFKKSCHGDDGELGRHV